MVVALVASSAWAQETVVVGGGLPSVEVNEAAIYGAGPALGGRLGRGAAIGADGLPIYDPALGRPRSHVTGLPRMAAPEIEPPAPAMVTITPPSATPSAEPKPAAPPPKPPQVAAATPPPAPPPPRTRAPEPAPPPKVTAVPAGPEVERQPPRVAAPAPEPAPAAEPAAEPAPAPMVEPEPEPVPAAETAPEPMVGPEPMPAPEPAPVAEPEPEPATATVAAATPAAAPTPPPKPATPEGEALTVEFAAGGAELPSGAEDDLAALAQQLDADATMRLQLKAYASAENTVASAARRLSLSRALAVRSFLIEKGVSSTRIDVRALGAKYESGPPDRVDVIAVR